MKIVKCSMIFLLFFAMGCATLRVRAPEKPIKVDVSMRLDVYQHVQSDIDAIESIVTGSGKSSKTAWPLSLLHFTAGIAYAQELGLPLEEAAMRRKARYERIISLERQGALGESNDGLLVIRGSDGSIKNMVADENKDRMLIYGRIAKKNGVPDSDIQKVYAARLQESAPPGTPVQAEDGGWRIK